MRTITCFRWVASAWLTMLVIGSVASLRAADAPAPTSTVLQADTPSRTVNGHTFIAPAGWTLTVKAPATILQAPEGDSWIALVDVSAESAEEALAAAWKVYKPDAKWPIKLTFDRPDRDGWTRERNFEYQTSPNERRDVGAIVKHGAGSWLVLINDMSQPVAEKRGAQLATIFSRLYPKGYSRESFAGVKPAPLDEKRLAELRRFVEEGRKQLRIPGVAVGVVQGGKIVLAEGFGVRELGKPAPVDADTLFMVASNTKGLTSLLLAKLVAEGKITWKTPVTKILPSFRLGDDETTRQVLVEHLICACTGLPRQDFEWLFQFQDFTPENSLGTLATMKPTTKFGELFQYSNPMAAAAGFVAGHVLYPDLDLGPAYDRAMQEHVFTPLGMKSTTFDFSRAMAKNFAAAHALDMEGNTAKAVMEVNHAVIPVGPAGAAWSNVRDMLAYISMELAGGKLPDGTTYLAKEYLVERRAPKVSIGKDTVYGMGLQVNTTYEVPVVHHGGDMIGYHSDMMWLPDHNVGAVVLTSGDPGWILRTQFRRKLLEVLFNGRPEADAQVASGAKAFLAQLAAERKLISLPADAEVTRSLAGRYSHPVLGEIAILRRDNATVFNFGEWQSEVGSRRNPDGTTSFLTTSPGVQGFEFVVSTTPRKRLILRDAQHEYGFEER